MGHNSEILDRINRNNRIKTQEAGLAHLAFLIIL